MRIFCPPQKCASGEELLKFKTTAPVHCPVELLAARRASVATNACLEQYNPRIGGVGLPSNQCMHRGQRHTPGANAAS